MSDNTYACPEVFRIFFISVMSILILIIIFTVIEYICERNNKSHREIDDLILNEYDENNNIIMVDIINHDEEENDSSESV